MYNEQIKEILMKTYDVCAYTLDCGSSAVRGKKLYYYTLDKDYEKEIFLFRNVLESQLSKKSIGCLNELMQFFPGDKWELPQCACYTETKGSWRLTFHYIKGVRYHRTFGKHIAATLILQNIPIIYLSEYSKDAFFGYWDATFYNQDRHRGEPQTVTEGINYRINRNLFRNIQFRSFTSSFFFMIANAEKKYILKDIGRTIKDWGYYLPSISLKSTLNCHTPSEVMSLVASEFNLLNINFNKSDMNVGYVIRKVSSFISEQDYPVLLKLTPEIVRNCISLKNLFDGLNSTESIKQFLTNYYRYERGFSEDEIYGFIGDYIHMSIECNAPIRLSSSSNKLKEAHDKLAELIREKEYLAAEQNVLLVATPSKFDDLEKTFNDLFANAFQRMHTSEQLLKEGEFQHNCVFSRRDLIRKDRVAIFHWNFENASHTIQFAIDRWGKYYIDEIKARYNQEPSWSAMTKLREMMAAVNFVD